MSIGEVVECGHYGGSGKCDCRSCRQGATSSFYVRCTACGGIGKAWVEPRVVNIHRGDDDDNDYDV